MKRAIKILSLVAVGVVLAGCNRNGEATESADAGSGALQSEPSPEEKRLIAAASPFVKAIASRNYADAYGMLSSHARARMSVNQFAPEDDDAKFARNEAQPRKNVTAEDFTRLVAEVEKEHGQPSAVRDIHVHETDPEVLSGKGNQLEIMFAIGNMPASVPTDIRRASLRCQIKTTLSAEQLKEAAKHAGVSPEELQKDEDFEPYFNLKVVLVEEEGSLRVGYFEFLPPSMLD